MSRREREARIEELLKQVQQQRLDLSAARRGWLEITAPYDRGWFTFLSLKRYLAIGSSALAIYSIRSPNRLLRWAKRGFGLWSTWRMIKSTLEPR